MQVFKLGKLKSSESFGYSRSHFSAAEKKSVKRLRKLEIKLKIEDMMEFNSLVFPTLIVMTKVHLHCRDIP